jgi:hypothetical protein
MKYENNQYENFLNKNVWFVTINVNFIAVSAQQYVNTNIHFNCR